MFEGSTMDDIWFINASIPLKDKPLVELVRSHIDRKSTRLNSSHAQ